MVWLASLAGSPFLNGLPPSPWKLGKIAMSVLLESLVRDTAIDAPSLPVGRQLLSFLIVGGSGAAAFVTLSSLAIGAHSGIANWIVSAIC